MSVVFILLPLALVIAAAAVAAFIWAVRDRQMDDLDTPPVRMLFDDDEPTPGAR
ncbi:MAG: cbb3-type cytochrome oxidase assembly protein CcoS [Planctomycetota bacterium]|nr:MAG: cbb3-type cytochrome oxidase assembly protein CcoS [Planctomycetota bacterium]